MEEQTVEEATKNILAAYSESWKQLKEFKIPLPTLTPEAILNLGSTIYRYYHSTGKIEIVV